MTAGGPSHGALDDILDAYELDQPAHREAATEAYETVRNGPGAFIVSIAAQMLPDLHDDVATRGCRIMFLGRDGHSLAVAIHGLDPLFFTAHCHNVVLSRAVVEAAIQDLEVNAGASFPTIDGYRQTRNRVDPTHIPGAFRHLTRYLRNAGVPAGRPNSAVTLVDSSLKGTVQELLSAAYPLTLFTGRYCFLSEAPFDPHPASKHGYALHRTREQAPHGDALRHLPADPDLTFACLDAISAIEDLMHGPLDTARRITHHGPDQIRQRDDPDTLGGFNPVLVQAKYRDPVMREAVKTIALLATSDAARTAVASRASDPRWLDRLREQQNFFTNQVRAWISGEALDPALRAILDGFVRRSDHRLVRQLAAGLGQRDVPDEVADRIWQHLAKLSSLEAKQQYVTGIVERRTIPPGRTFVPLTGVSMTATVPDTSEPYPDPGLRPARPLSRPLTAKPPPPPPPAHRRP
jgi:hypothetical protein